MVFICSSAFVPSVNPRKFHAHGLSGGIYLILFWAVLAYFLIFCPFLQLFFQLSLVIISFQGLLTSSEEFLRRLAIPTYVHHHYDTSLDDSERRKQKIHVMQLRKPTFCAPPSL